MITQKLLLTLSILLCLTHSLSVAAEDTKACFAAIYDLNENRLDDAIASYTLCIDEGQLGLKNLIVAHNDRGNAFGKKGNYVQALADFNAVIQLDHKDPDAFYNRGLTYKKLDRLDKALADYSQAIQLKPGYAKAYNNRGSIYGEKGEFKNAIMDFSQAISLKSSASAFFNRGLAFYSLGEFENAISDLEQAIELNPKYAKAFEHLAWLRATCPEERLRDGAIALVLAKKARFLSPDGNANLFDIMAAAYAALGNYDNAVRYQQLAIAAQNNQSPPRQEKLDLYENGKAYRDTVANRFLMSGS